MSVTFSALGLAVVIAAGIFLRASRIDHDWKRGNVFLPTALVTATLLAVHLACTNSFYGLNNDWNGGRLAPLLSLTRGYALYYPSDQGPITNHIYGPLGALAYFPVLAFRSAVPMVLTAVTIAFLFVAVPLFVCHWRLRGAGSENFLKALLVFLVALLSLSLHYGTRYWYEQVHADGPVLGFGLLACSFVMAAPSRRSLWLAALFTALALFTKQTAIGVPFGIAVYLWIAHGAGTAGRYALAVIGLCTVFGLLAILAFGFGPLYFNTITVPSRHPLKITNPVLLLKDALDYVVFPAFLILPGLALVWSKVRTDRRALRTEAAARPWILFLLVTLFMIPTSLLGRVKEGGETNSYHFVLYFHCAVSLSILQAWIEPSTGRPRVLAQGVAMGACAVVLAAGAYRQIANFEPADGYFRTNVFRQGEDYVKAFPGQVYMPTNPLCPLLAESRLDHFDYGVYDRSLAGYAPSPARLRAHLPPRVKYLAHRTFPRVMLTLTEDFRWRRTLDDPTPHGWNFYVATP